MINLTDGKRFSCLVIVVTVMISMAANAQPSSEDVTQLRPELTGLRLKQSNNALEVGYGRESLTNNYSDWTNTYLIGSRKLGERQVVYGGLRETERFGLKDSEVHAGLYFPLGRTWGGHC